MASPYQRKKNQKKISCDQCSHTSSTKGNMKKHKKAVHWKIKDYQCSECDKCFSEKSSLEAHDLFSKINKVQCFSCYKSFCHKDDLNKHTREIHMKIQNYQCSQCEKSFSQKQNLAIHFKRIHT